MWLYWWMRGQFTIGRRLAEQCLSPDLPSWEQARINLAAATMTYAACDQAAAASYWAEADRIAAGQDDPEVRSKARAGTGLAALAVGDPDAAENRFQAALAFAADDRSSTWMASLVQVWLGTVHLLRGDPAAAVPEIERGLDLARLRGDRLSTYVALYNLSQAALARGDYALARQRVEEGITLAQETRDLANLAYLIETLAVIESQEGNHLRVATLVGAATGLRETVGADIYASSCLTRAFATRLSKQHAPPLAMRRTTKPWPQASPSTHQQQPSSPSPWLTRAMGAVGLCLEVMLQHISDQGAHAVGVGFRFDPGSVNIDGLDARPQLPGDELARQAVDHQPQHLAFAWRQAVELRADLAPS